MKKVVQYVTEEVPVEQLQTMSVADARTVVTNAANRVATESGTTLQNVVSGTTNVVRK
jgi:hypothetical protein